MSVPASLIDEGAMLRRAWDEAVPPRVIDFISEGPLGRCFVNYTDGSRKEFDPRRTGLYWLGWCGMSWQ